MLAYTAASLLLGVLTFAGGCWREGPVERTVPGTRSETGGGVVDDTRTTLSTLWVVVMFNMAFADILTFIKPGALQDL
jgi:hypothetical protein